MVDIVSFTPERVFTLTGIVAPGASYTVRFYLSGTTTPATVYQDIAATVPHGTPITANSNGTFAAIYAASGAGALKAVIQTATGGTFATIDPVFRSPLSASEAANIGFAPTADIVETNVQDAIVAVRDAIDTTNDSIGMGIIGNAPLLTAIDATTIPSGFYRFATGTTGTFPTGITAASTGFISMMREDTNDGVMFLFPGGSLYYVRDLAAGVWVPWREVVSVPQGGAQGDTIYRAASVFSTLSKGAAGQVLRQNDGLTAPEWGSPGVTGAAQTLSGAGPFSQAVPTWATRAEVMIFGGSMSGSTDNQIVQFSTGGAYVTSGYTSYVSISGNGFSSSAGMIAVNANASASVRAIMSLRKITGNTWIAAISGSVGTGTDDGVTGSGSIALAGAIDGIRLARSGTTDTFDAGSVAVYWS